MLYMQDMQNNMYKICNEYANKYAEYVNKYVKKMQNMQNMQNHLPICRICKKEIDKNMLKMQNMQNNMYKICNKYANKYAEYVNKYVKNMQNMQLKNMQNMHSTCCSRHLFHCLSLCIPEAPLTFLQPPGPFTSLCPILNSIR